jgi:hypothetical protein
LKLVRNLVVAVAVKVKIVKFLTCRCNICWSKNRCRNK